MLVCEQSKRGPRQAVDETSYERVRELCVNFVDESGAYPAPAPARSNPGYVIVTTEAIAAGSSQLANFAAHQQARGFAVQVATEAQFGGGAGDVAAENIRNWLADHYLADQIEYVLLIGDPRPTSSIPMKVLYPRRDNLGQPEPHPSDYYYADLTGNWDLDGDGYYGEGEPPEDFGPGGFNVHWEVLVGRIPFYGNYGQLDAILSKTIAYQSASGPATEWRQNALLPMKPSDDSTPGYHLGEQIKNDVLTGAAWGYHRIYDEDYGLTPPPETTPCTVGGVSDVWANNPFGLVVWWTHGNSQGAYEVMDTAHVPLLNDAYPAFTFQGSCSNSYPEDTNNLAYSLLRHGGIATVGATRSSWYWVGETSFSGSSSGPGMGYAYAARVVQGASAGLAMHALKQSLWDNNMWTNYVVFGVYGDPSTRLVQPLTGSIHNLTQDTWHATIQAALDLAHYGDEIILSPGTYSGAGNHDIVLGGMAVTIRSADPNDPDVVAATILDLQGSPAAPRRAFLTGIGDGPDTVIAGLTIRNGYASGGGAIRCQQASSPTIRDCVFQDNVSSWNGGAITNTGGSQPMILRCRFVNNTAIHGGAVTNEGGSHAAISDCTFAGNGAAGNGGAIDNYKSSPTIVRCTFLNNAAGGYGGGVLANADSHPLIEDCTFTANTANYAGGGAAAVGLCNVQVRRSLLSGNSSLYGGGMFIGDQSAPVIENCQFLANTASGNGGAADVNNSTVQFRDCLVGGNQVTGGGAGGGIILSTNSNVAIYNSTVVGNFAPNGGGVCIADATLNVRNTVLRGNSDNSGGGQAAQLFHSGGTLAVNYSCVAGWTGSYGGVGNHGQNPQFVDPDGADNDPNTWKDNNYRVNRDSPCTEAGDPAYVPTAGERDLDGQPRVRDGDGDGADRVDMGAYEYDREDIDGDGFINLFDWEAFAACMAGAEVALPGG